jgi:predicted helicase
LDQLEANDFENILQWMRGEKFEPKLFTPRSHQQEAIDKILEGLKSEDRVTSVMPCGTGKTLVALWVAERLKGQKILVLVPSLMLLSQTLQEWMKQTRLEKEEISYIAVCSDPKVKKASNYDEWVLDQSDLDFPVTTDSQVVADFLQQEIDVTKIVFSTYQSSPVVAEGMSETDRFDFAVFDEAHKTAGRQGTKFSFALDDDKLPIKKRLFMTATPRHYNINKTNKDGDHQLVYSMDDVQKYGQRVHQLSFNKALEIDPPIICDYKVLISVVTSQEVNDELLSQSEVLVGTDFVMARQVANQIVLERAVEKYQTGKIITFHGRVQSARSFVIEGDEEVGYHLTNFDYWYINGKMNTSERESIMREFKNADNSIISNARCLTEGVDVPAVDMVCFMSPKKSKVDIVQAVGRAMRTSDDKEFGYILIPLYLEREMGESIEDALARTDFKEVWNVINAIKEQDEVLNDVIGQMRIDKGKRKGFDDSRFREKVEILGAELDLSTLKKSIIVELVDRLGSNWDEMYGQLMAYKDEFGHCLVPARWGRNPQLATWVSSQRGKAKRKEIKIERFEKLTAIGFSWDSDEDYWNQMFEQLKRYKETHGDCQVTRSINYKLSTWIAHQRSKKFKKKLEEGRIHQLEKIGFSWDPDEDHWNQMFEQLKRYKETHGDCKVPPKWERNRQLGIWVGGQRSAKKKEVWMAKELKN